VSARKNSTRDKIVDATLDVLSVSGFSRLTLSVIAKRVGMSKSGLFAHFESKDDLACAVLQRMTNVWNENVVRPSSKLEAGLPRLSGYVVHWLGWPSKAGLGGGCPLAAALFELDDLPGPIRTSLAEREKQWREAIKN
jgi:AcrR family transcriptional regulator